MSVRITLIALGLLFWAGGTFAQQHAPTLDVCKADVALWYDHHSATDYLNQETKHMSDGVPNTSPYNKLPITEVVARLHEMGDCLAVSEYKDDRYSQAQQFYSGIFTDRLKNFLDRHHLMEQLMTEDEAGMR